MERHLGHHAEEARRARDTHIMKMIAAIRKVDEEMEARAEKKTAENGEAL